MDHKQIVRAITERLTVEVSVDVVFYFAVANRVGVI